MKLSIGQARQAQSPPASATVDPQAIEASVIVPALNAAAHIEEQLLALAAQVTEVAWELIVADNGSADDTLAIVRRVAASFPVPLRALDASDRIEAMGARNAGASVASGRLLLFTDADDVVDERWVDEMVRALQAHPFVGGRLEIVALNGEEVASWREMSFDDRLPSVHGSPYVLGANFGCTAAAFEAVGGFQETVPGWNDVDFSLVMAAHGMPASFARRAIVHYRYRDRPLQAARRMWRYGRQTGMRYARYGMEPPSFLDQSVLGYRLAKRCAREAMGGRLPMAPFLTLTYVLAESAGLSANPAFWQPVYRLVPPAKPWRVQRDRLDRFRRWITLRVRARRS